MTPRTNIIIPVITSNGTPSNSVGVNGQFAYDYANGFMFGPKSAGVWPAGVRLKDDLYIQSRLQNLVTNGSGLLGNNTNFSTLTFDSVETHGGGGSFASTDVGQKTSEEYLPVDTGKYYRQVVWAKSGNIDGTEYNSAARFYLGVKPYDIDFLEIGIEHIRKFVGSTDTTLAVELKAGDTTITLTNATGWAGTNAIVNNRQMIWYSYTNSKGFIYPDYTYSRNTTFSNTAQGYRTNGLWAVGGISGNVITLTAAWPGPTIAAGVAVRNGSGKGSYKYHVASGIAIGTSWTKFEGTIGDIEDSVYTDNKFNYGTAYVRIFYSINSTISAGANRIRFSDIWFSELSARNLEPASATEPGVVGISTQTFAGDKTFSGAVAVNNAVTITKTTAQIRKAYSGSVYCEDFVNSSGDLEVFQTGDEIFYKGNSSTQSRTIASIKRTMPTATDASRTGEIVHSVSDFAAARAYLKATANGTGLEIKIGGNADTNAVVIEADGTLRLDGTAVVYEDLNFDPDASGGPAVSLPDFVEINNVIHREFTSANNQKCGCVKELPHSAKISGTNTLYPHYHCFLKSGESAGTTGATFTLYWELRQDAGVTSGSVPLTVTSTELTNNPYKFTMNDTTGFTGPTEIGAQLAMAIARTGGDAGDVIITTYGVHFPIDTMGSRDVTTK
jgi:hypothetical protein